MKIIPVLIATLLIAFVPGCAKKPAVSQAQCEMGDWQSMGHRDGARGQRSSDLLDLQEACFEYGISADREQYMAGWNAGVRDYCVPSNAYTVGESGRGHANVCPEDLREPFLAAYQQGRELHLARQKVGELKTAIDRDTARLEQVRADIVSTAAAQLNPVLTPTRRAELVAQLQSLNDEKNRLTVDIPQHRLDLVTAERELDALEQRGFQP